MVQPDITGREKLVIAARELFASQGVDAVSLREVSRAADQRNPNAVQYHFGDRDALLDAVLEPHDRLVGARRSALLDELEAMDAPPARALASALVRPSAAMLTEPGGRHYLQITSQLVADPTFLRRRRQVHDTGWLRWDAIARSAMPSETLPLHRRFSATQLCFNELGRRAASRRSADYRLFVSDLVDLVAGVLEAPVSDETAALLAERRGA